MRKFLFETTALTLFSTTLLSGVSYAQPRQAANITITPTTVPEVVQVLDNTGQWVPIGSVISGTHVFEPVDTLGWINVGKASIGMAPGGQDNSPYLANIISQIAPFPVNNTGSGGVVYIPPIPSQSPLYYYFSRAFDWNRTGKITCSSNGNYSNVNLVFAPGVDGIVMEGYQTSGDGSFSEGSDVAGCGIISLGSGIGGMTTGGNLIENMRTNSYGPITPPAWEVGDGVISTIRAKVTSDYRSTIINSPPYYALTTVLNGTFITAINSDGSMVMNSNASFNSMHGLPTVTATATASFSTASTSITLTSNTGCNGVTSLNTAYDTAFSPPKQIAKVKSCVGSTLTLSGTSLINSSGASDTIQFYQDQWIYRLPQELAYHATTTIDSNTVVLSGGPNIPIKPDDLIFSDAFPLGAIVFSASGVVPNQTITLYAMSHSAPTNATVAHVGGSGRIWRIPSGINRLDQGYTHFNHIYAWPIGIKSVCTSGAGVGCTNNGDYDNQIQANGIGKVTGSNNAGASTSYNNIYGDNWIADVIADSLIADYYYGDGFNSFENVGAFGMIGQCSFPSLIIGTYFPAQLPTISQGTAATPTPYCMAADGLIEQPPLPGTPDWGTGTPPLILDGSLAPPTDTMTLDGGGFHVGASGVPFLGQSVTYSTAGAGSAGATINGNFSAFQVSGGLEITDLTRPVIPAGTTILANNFANVTISAPQTGTGVQAGDLLALSGEVSPVAGRPTVNMVGNGMFFTKASGNGGFFGWQFGWNGVYGTGGTYGGGVWGWDVAGQTVPAFFLANFDYNGYSAGNTTFGLPGAPSGILLGNVGGYDPSSLRLLDFGPVAPSPPPRQRGDFRINSAPSAGGIGCWQAVADATAFNPGCPISGDPNGLTWPAGKDAQIGFNLPTCDATHSVGMNAVVTNGIASPTYLQAVTGVTGSSRRRLFCDAVQWLYD